MKTMKIATILVLSFLCTGILSSQEFKIPFQNSKDGKLILRNFIGTLPIEGYSGNDIIITSASPAETFNPPEKAPKWQGLSFGRAPSFFAMVYAKA